MAINTQKVSEHTSKKKQVRKQEEQQRKIQDKRGRDASTGASSGG